MKIFVSWFQETMACDPVLYEKWMKNIPQKYSSSIF